jgi:hypothetical protein
MSTTELPGIAHMANDQKQPGITSVHEYHAEASVLKARLIHPLEEEVHPRAKVKLPKNGHYRFRHADPFRVEGVISYRYGYTQVAGHPSSKKNGFATLATSVLEGVTVLDVLTADRVVAQISTVHPEFATGKQVPEVTFLGTRFENLRIGGRKIEIEPAPDFLGDPKEDASYFDDATRKTQSESIEKLDPPIPEMREWNRDEPKDDVEWTDAPRVTSSVVGSISGVPEAYKTPFNHVIDVPHFGRIFLGELIIRRLGGVKNDDPEKRENDRYRFNLTMIRLEMGCVGTGTASLVMADSNGQGTGGHH